MKTTRPSQTQKNFFLRAVCVFLLLSSVNAGAQVSRRYYPRLDLEAKNIPADIDTVTNWINAYTSRQFVKNPMYSNGYMHNFYLSLRHLKDLNIMGGPLTLVAAPVNVDSTKEPFTGLLYVDVRKSRENLQEMDLTVQSYLHFAKDHLHWNTGTALYRASWHLVDAGRAHKENQRDIARLKFSSGSAGIGFADTDHDKEDYTKIHFNFLIDTLNTLLGTAFPHGMKSNELADSLRSLGYTEELIVDSLFFKDRSPKQKDSMLNLMFYMEGGIQEINDYLTHTVEISGFPFDLKIPVAAIDSAYRPAGDISDTITLDVWECKIELRPGGMEYQILTRMTGKFRTKDGPDTPKRYLYIVFYPEQGQLSYYDPGAKEFRTWLRWDY